eukprot:404173_1
MNSLYFVLFAINSISSTNYKILIEDATGLLDADDDFGWITNESDVYVVVYSMGARNICISQTSTKDGTLSPSWNTEFECEFQEGDPSEKCENFQFVLWDEDMIGDDDHLGTTERFYVSDVKKCGEWVTKQMDVWLNGNTHGTLNVAMSKDCEITEN